MAALQCEICGGKLIAKAGGIFECDSCGMQYDKSRIQEMVQEIKGTVKVEGTVEVQGKVQVEGAANKESLLKRGFMALEDAKWNDADDFFDKVLDIDPECGEAYLGKLLAELQVNKRENLKDYAEPFDGSKNYQKVLRFGDAALVSEVSGANESIIVRNKKREERRIAKLAEVRERIRPATGLVVAGCNHTVGLKSDGTVVATEYTGSRGLYKGQCKVSNWRDIVAVAAGQYHTVGLKSDGTVVATEYTGYRVDDDDRGQCEVSGWHDIVAIAAGVYHTVGLKSDGTVVATRYAGDKKYYDGQCEVSGWRDIVAIAVGDDFTIGLKSDGTVVAVGDNYSGQCEVSGWHDIVAIAAGVYRTVGLKSDGTVVAAGGNYSGQCEVSGWRDIVAITAGRNCTIGLVSDGTVVATRYAGDKKYYDGQCEVSGWRDIVAIATGDDCTIGLKSDGTVVATRYTGDKKFYCGQGEISGWKLFNSIDTLEQERAAAKKAAEERRIAEITSLNSEKSALSTEFANLKGLFTGKRRKEIEARLAEIDAELKKLNG